MELAAAGIALVQGAELAIRYGKRIVTLVQAYKSAESGLRDLVLRVEGVWLKTEIQINVILDLSTSNHHRLLSFQEECVDRLRIKLYNALRLLESYTGSNHSQGIASHNLYQDIVGLNRRTKAKYGLFGRRLVALISDLEEWHSIFDPSWYLLTRLVSGKVDDALKQTVGESSTAQTVTTVQEIRAIVHSSSPTPHSERSKLPILPTDYLSNYRELAAGSSLYLATIAQTGQAVLLDHTAYQDDVDPNIVLNTVKEMTQLLSISDPFPLGFLKCLGVLPGNDRQFQYVLSLPRQDSPQTLRSLLQQQQESNSPSLDAKLRIGKSLSRAVLSLHTANFVHKNIRPETIILLPDNIGEMSEPYLVGFEQLRPSSGHSALFADMVWHRNLYRHPNRQGLRPQEYYKMQHDIYSLGVCLLEIGLWTSFVELSRSSDEEPCPSALLDICAELGLKNKPQAALKIKEKLIAQVKARLPSLMGRTYTDVTLSCLTCLDQGASNIFDDEQVLYDENGILVGVAFIEKVLVRLEGIRV